VDGQTLFIGSMNFDPRSASHNTELAIIVQSHELARQQLKLIDALKEQGAYQLRTAADGEGVEWISREAGEESILHNDPDTSVWDRTLPTLLLPLVPEGWL
jgi:putative cardiolipin synthase